MKCPQKEIETIKKEVERLNKKAEQLRDDYIAECGKQGHEWGEWWKATNADVRHCKRC